MKNTPKGIRIALTAGERGAKGKLSMAKRYESTRI
ncbi:hypothetical protein TBK1r_58260 [Stieleria magnilauensis]|uniref:Uncharacterized protein n=1 Tax=Stieleria magnilauensis TaxID=2527963 RepID=A0ABX5XYG7_9BACT|nr:hypothetical protein TBK1r_58260 [Planctomycetes bacterium TBK1r]